MLLELACFVAVAVAGLVISKMVSFIMRLQAELMAPPAVVLEDPDSPQPATLPSIYSPPSKSLSVIIPAYNEQERLAATLDETISHLMLRRKEQGLHFTWEIIVVDDGSKDNTVRVAMEYVRNHGFDAVRVLRVPKNRGKGHAVRRGMLCARGEYCLFIDADGATRFSDLDMLEAALGKIIRPAGSSAAAGDGGPVAAAFGSRAHLSKAAAAKRSGIRNLLTKGFHFLVTFVAGSRTRDTQCGFKLFTRRAAAMLYGNQRLQRWCFDVELIYLADVLEVPLTEVFVEWTEMPGSKIRATSILSMAWELVAIKAGYQLLGLWHVFSEAELQRKNS